MLRAVNSSYAISTLEEKCEMKSINIRGHAANTASEKHTHSQSPYDILHFAPYAHFSKFPLSQP